MIAVSNCVPAPGRFNSLASVRIEDNPIHWIDPDCFFGLRVEIEVSLRLRVVVAKVGDRLRGHCEMKWGAALLKKAFILRKVVFIVIYNVTLFDRRDLSFIQVLRVVL